jgi:hypothetical protein
MAMSPQEWPAIHEALSSIGFHWSSTIIWAKDSLVVSRKDYHTQYEPLYYAWRGDAARLCPVEDRTQSDLWQIPRPKRSDMHPCLSPDSIINSRSGYVRIGDVVPGDDVLGHDGKLHRVDAVTVHEYSEDIYRIQVRGVKMAVDATHNHPFLVLRKNRDVGFFEAGLLEVGDYILSPTGVCESDVADDPGEDVAFVAGLFAAEGSFLSSGHGTSIYPRFSLHKNEESLIARIQNATQKNVKVYPNGSGNGINVVMFDSCMGEKLLAWCGRGAANKKLPGVLVWSEKSQRAVFDGYVAGDGALIRHNTIAKTVSQALAGQLVILAESLGYRTTVNIHSSPLNAGIGERQFKNTLPCYVVTMAKTKVRTFYSGIVQYEGVDFLMRRIQTIARIPYDGLVTNLVVDGCHTFQTAIGMSHNTMKPIALVERSLQNSSKPGNLVFEPFSGSGTTLIASARTNRHARACELDPRYVSCALERWNELTGGMPVRVKA